MDELFHRTKTPSRPNAFHNLTAHYNGFYYAVKKTHEVELVILKSLDDDHNQILRLFPRLE